MAVTVLLAFRDDLPYLNMALDSILRQTRPADEVLLVDDRSTRATLAELRKRIEVPIRLIANQGAGVAHARNTGLRAAIGDLVIMHDSDDLSRPTRIEELTAYADAHPAVGAVGSLCDYIGADSQPADTPWTREYGAACDWAVTPDDMRAFLPTRCCVIPASLMFRRDVVLSVGGFDPTFTSPSYDLLLRLLPVADIAKLPTRLYAYRLHDQSHTARTPETHAEQLRLAQLAHAARTKGR